MRDDRRLRIGLISEEFPPETGWGGIGTYTWNLAKGLAAGGHRVHVISRTWEAQGTTDLDGVQVHRAAVAEPSWRLGTHWFNLYLREFREIALWNRKVAAIVDRICEREGLDVIECPEFHAQGLLTSLRHSKTPMVVKLHTPTFLCRRVNGVIVGGSGLDSALGERMELWLAKRASLLTSPSKALAEDVALDWSIDPSAVRVIPNPIDEETFRPGAHETRAEDSVLFVGRLERRKGVETLIDAWAAVRREVAGANLRLVGSDHESGPNGMSMKAHLSARLAGDDAVKFAGAIERGALPAVYQSAAVCIVPSLYENFPYVCLEAMACGCAVVASSVGGIPEIINDGEDGLLVPPGQPDALSTAITRLLNDDALRRRLGASARETITRRFSRDAIVAQTLMAYRTVLRSSQQSTVAATLKTNV